MTFDIAERRDGNPSDKIIIDNSGVIGIRNNAPSGVYTIDVKATNKHGTTTIPLTFTYFTSLEIMAAEPSRVTLNNLHKSTKVIKLSLLLQVRSYVYFILERSLRNDL